MTYGGMLSVLVVEYLIRYDNIANVTSYVFFFFITKVVFATSTFTRFFLSISYVTVKENLQKNGLMSFDI